MPSAVTVNTVQGIGDIFWVYQKLAPYFDRINLNVLCIGGDQVQTRARAFCRMLPKVGEVNYVRVTIPAYHLVAQTRYAISNILRSAARGPLDYAVNSPLERGVNLRDIDPGTQIAEFVDLGLPADVPREDYLCAFVAGAKGPTVWTAQQWADLIETLAQRLGVARIVLIGAAWDVQVQTSIETILRRVPRRRRAIENLTATMELAASIDVIRRARYFIGFQSGLNVIAENYDVPQTMLYFSALRPMMFTWCKPGNLGTLFNAATFDDDPGRVLDRLKLA